MTNPFLKRLEKERIGDSGRRSEKRVAKSLGGKLTPASGAMNGAKGDFKKDQFLGEAKSSTARSIALEQDWLIKIAHEAVSCGKVPLLTISFVSQDGKPRTKRNAEWVLLPRWAFEDLISPEGEQR